MPKSAGYFTYLKWIVNKTPAQLETALGYTRGSLASGWELWAPSAPIVASNLDLRGSTRFEDGIVPSGSMKGRPIGDVLGQRMDLSAARGTMAAFFDRGIDQRPVKVRSKGPAGYEPAPHGSAIPQFKLFEEIEWVVVATVPAGGILGWSDISM